MEKQKGCCNESPPNAATSSIDIPWVPAKPSTVLPTIPDPSTNFDTLIDCLNSGLFGGLIEVPASHRVSNAIALEPGVVIPGAIPALIILPQQGHSHLAAHMFFPNRTDFCQVPMHPLLHNNILLRLVQAFLIDDTFLEA